MGGDGTEDEEAEIGGSKMGEVTGEGGGEGSAETPKGGEDGKGGSGELVEAGLENGDGDGEEGPRYPLRTAIGTVRGRI